MGARGPQYSNAWRMLLNEQQMISWTLSQKKPQFLVTHTSLYFRRIASFYLSMLMALIS